MACYDLTVRIDVPERRVTVGGSFDVNFLGSDSIALVLWRHARIDTMRCDSHEAAYRFDTLAPAPTRFIPDGRALTLYRPARSPDRCRIGTRYTLDMHEVQGPQNRSTTAGSRSVTIRDGIPSATAPRRIARTCGSALPTAIR